MSEIHQALKPARRRLRRNCAQTWAAWGLAAGGIAAVCLLAAAYWVPVPGKGLWAGAAAAGGALLGALAGALRPVKDPEAARAADACGLKQRAETALEVTEGPAAELLHRDAVEKLRSLDARAIRPRSVKKPLLAALGCAVACAVMLLIPGEPDRAMERTRLLRTELAAQADAVDAAAEADSESLSETERQELRRLTGELRRDLADSRTEEDAMIAADRAEQRLERLRNKDGGDVREAMEQAGAGDLAAALEAGDMAAAAAALAAMSPETLDALGNGLEGEPKNRLAEAVSSQAAGDAAGTEEALQGLRAAMGQTSSGAAPKTANALRNLKGSLGAGSSSGQGNQAGQGTSASSGTGNGKSPGNGAGEGSTNEEQAGGTQTGNTQHASGSRDPRYKEEQYETIYDPEHADVGTRDVQTEQHAGEEDSVQIETGPGRGSLSGDVPYGQVVREYAETEVRAADGENLTRREREWVDAYFTLLTAQE